MLFLCAEIHDIRNYECHLLSYFELQVVFKMYTAYIRRIFQMIIYLFESKGSTISWKRFPISMQWYYLYFMLEDNVLSKAFTFTH